MKHSRIEIEGEYRLGDQTSGPHVVEEGCSIAGRQARIGQTQYTITDRLVHTDDRGTFDERLILHGYIIDLRTIMEPASTPSPVCYSMVSLSVSQIFYRDGVSGLKYERRISLGTPLHSGGIVSEIHIRYLVEQ